MVDSVRRFLTTDQSRRSFLTTSAAVAAGIAIGQIAASKNAAAAPLRAGAMERARSPGLA